MIQDEGLSVKVYSDKNNEDFTHEFSIDVYKERNYEMTNIEIQEKGDLKGYAVFVVEVEAVPLEGLYRICDPENGPDMTVVSIDYGAEYDMVERCWDDIENELFNATYEKYIEILKEKEIVKVCDFDIWSVSYLEDRLHAKLSEKLKNGDSYIRQSDGIGTIVLEMVDNMDKEDLPYISVALDDLDEDGGRIENTDNMKCLWNSVYGDAVDCFEHFEECLKDFAKSVSYQRNEKMKVVDLETHINQCKEEAMKKEKNVFKKDKEREI